VRYCGPTSHPRDHLIHQAAHGVQHIWAASIVAGLAVVLTGFMAYTGVQAESAPRVKNLNEAVAALWRKLDQVERMVKEMHDVQMGDPSMLQGGGAGACAERCGALTMACLSQVEEGSQEDTEACRSIRAACVKQCVQEQDGEEEAAALQGAAFDPATAANQLWPSP
jgi:hypothetical protein